MVTRLYFSLTNNCNLRCPFCCMHSGPGKSTYFPSDRLEAILRYCRRPFEMQLEGGEPFLNPNWYNCMLKAYETGLCQRVILCTNGLLLNDVMPSIQEFKECFPILIKISINHHIFKVYPECIDNASRLVEAYPHFDFRMNVRIADPKADSEMLQQLSASGLLNISNVFPLQRYGRAANNKHLELPYIVQNVDDWYLFSSDGKNFGHKLVERSEYERELP